MIFKLLKINIYFLSFLAFASCTTINIQSEGRFPVYIKAAVENNTSFVITENFDFYLWGYLPDEHNISIDKILWKNSFSEVSQIEVSSYQSWKDLFLTALTLGFYVPQTVLVQGLGKKRNFNDEVN